MSNIKFKENLEGAVVVVVLLVTKDAESHNTISEEESSLIWSRTFRDFLCSSKCFFLSVRRAAFECGNE